MKGRADKVREGVNSAPQHRSCLKSGCSVTCVNILKHLIYTISKAKSMQKFQTAAAADGGLPATKKGLLQQSLT